MKKTKQKPKGLSYDGGALSSKWYHQPTRFLFYFIFFCFFFSTDLSSACESLSTTRCVCRTAANVEYQRGDRSSIDDARLSKSIEFDPHPLYSSTYANLAENSERCTQTNMHAAWDRVYRVWKWEDERRRRRIWRRVEMLEVEATSTRRYMEVENIETWGGKSKAADGANSNKKKGKNAEKGEQRDSRRNDGKVEIARLLLLFVAQSFLDTLIQLLMHIDSFTLSLYIFIHTVCCIYCINSVFFLRRKRGMRQVGRQKNFVLKRVSLWALFTVDGYATHTNT